jgi:hypothetical protein
MKLTHWQYLAGLDSLESPCLTLSYVSAAGVCLHCGHDPHHDYKMRFTMGAPLPASHTARVARRKPKAKAGRPMPRATRALLGL